MSFRTSNYWGPQPFTADRSQSSRVVVINERDIDKIPEKMTDWLFEHYPGLQVIQLATVKQNNRIYNRATFKTANGQRKVILFDVTAAYQNNMHTAMRVFRAGTMIRLTPSTGSTPTRMQVLY